MKRFVQHLFTLSVFLLTLSFSLDAFAGSNPNIRRYAQGGGGQGDPCIPDDGEDHTVKFMVIFDDGDLSFLHTCNLYVGYALPSSGETFIAIPATGFVPLSPGSIALVHSFEITLTAADIEAMCNTKDYDITIDMYCSEFDVLESITNGEGVSFAMNLCCAAHGQGFVTTGSDKMNTLDIKMVSDLSDKAIQSDFSDYYIYDLQGNQISILKEKSTKISPQEHISNLDINTGIYIIRYYEDKKLRSTKVFKL